MRMVTTKSRKSVAASFSLNDQLKIILNKFVILRAVDVQSKIYSRHFYNHTHPIEYRLSFVLDIVERMLTAKSPYFKVMGKINFRSS